MKIPVDEKKLRVMQLSIGDVLIVGEKIEQFTHMSICKACFTNARAI
jgi:hypothetical protein